MRCPACKNELKFTKDGVGVQYTQECCGEVWAIMPGEVKPITLHMLKKKELEQR